MKKIFSLLLALALIVSISANLSTTQAQAATVDSSYYRYRADMTVTANSFPMYIEQFEVNYNSVDGYWCLPPDVYIGGERYASSVQSIANSGGQTVVKIKVYGVSYEFDYEPGEGHTGTFHPEITLRFYGRKFSGATIYFNFKWRATSEVTHCITSTQAKSQSHQSVYMLCNVVVAASGSCNFGYGSASLSCNSTCRYKQVPRDPGVTYYRLQANTKKSLTFDMKGQRVFVGGQARDYWVKDILIPM